METLAQTRAQQLIHAERLSTMGLLSAGLAHEINNPLTYIHSYAEYVRDDLEALQAEFNGILNPSESTKESVDSRFLDCKESIAEIIRGSQRIMSLVENMKHLSRADDQSRGRVDIVQCIENAMKLCQFDLKLIQVTLDTDDVLPDIMGNRQQIEQVLINLIKNAVDAMENDPSAALILTAKMDEKSVRITVADNGPGIPEDKLSSIWEAFYTTKTDEKGTGLGLSISKGIIEDYGGSIRVSNITPHGACFTIELPPADALDFVQEI